jgi:hypothetical protein
MKEVLAALPGILLTILCWGAYGPVLHKGQAGMGMDRLKPLICVGLAYFLIAILVPTMVLAAQGKLQGGWNFWGIVWSLGGGVAGAVGALGIILALSNGGKPLYVMPLVFGCAPIVNVLTSNFLSGNTLRSLSPLFLAGVIIVAVGASIVMMAAPKGHAKPAPTAGAPAAADAAESNAGH